MSSPGDVFWRMPPVTRTMVAISVILSPCCYMGILPFGPFLFIKDYIFTLKMIPQIWRVVPCNFITTEKLGMIFDPYMLYTYSSQIEISGNKFRSTADYLVFIVFVCLTNQLLAGVYLGGAVMMSSLLIALTYTYAQEDPNRATSFFFVTFPAMYLPYAQLVIIAVQYQHYYPALIAAMGIPSAHLFLFLTKYWPEYGQGKQWIHTPEFLHRLFSAPAGTATNRGAGTAFSGAPAGGAQNAQPTRGGSWTSGFGRNGGGVWNQRGQGHRLGGD